METYLTSSTTFHPISTVLLFTCPSGCSSLCSALLVDWSSCKRTSNALCQKWLYSNSETPYSPCGAWPSCKGTKHRLRIDSFSQYSLVLDGSGSLACAARSSCKGTHSHNWLLLSVLYLVLHDQLAKIKSTVSLTLIGNALPCAACTGTKHCPRNDSYFSALPCAAWPYCLDKKHGLTIESSCQCFT